MRIARPRPTPGLLSVGRAPFSLSGPLYFHSGLGDRGGAQALATLGIVITMGVVQNGISHLEVPQACSREDNCLSKSECRPTHPWNGEAGEASQASP